MRQLFYLLLIGAAGWFAYDHFKPGPPTPVVQVAPQPKDRDRIGAIIAERDGRIIEFYRKEN